MGEATDGGSVPAVELQTDRALAITQ